MIRVPIFILSNKILGIINIQTNMGLGNVIMSSILIFITIVILSSKINITNEHNKSFYKGGYLVTKQTVIYEHCGYGILLETKLINPHILSQSIDGLIIKNIDCLPMETYMNTINQYSNGSYHEVYINICCDQIKNKYRYNTCVKAYGECYNNDLESYHHFSLPLILIIIPFVVEIIKFFMYITLFGQ